MKPKRQGKITVSYPGAPAQPPPQERLSLHFGWLEVWEHGKYLGLYEHLPQLDRYIAARPGRRFRVRFFDGSPAIGLRLVGSATAFAAEGKWAAEFDVQFTDWRQPKGRKT